MNQIKAASAIRDATRALGHEYAVGDKLSKMIPDAVLGITRSLADCLKMDEMEKAYNEDPTVKEILDAAIGLEGIYRHPGIHAAAVVNSRNPMTEYVPVMQNGEDKPVVTQWDMDRVEQCGLLKVDFLGLRNLGVIDICVKQVKKHHDIDIDIDNLPLNDALVYDSLRNGQSIGCFQIESEGMRQMMLELQPEDLFDIMALISLYRPGPMGSGMDQMYINRKHGREAIRYPHESLEAVLDKSKGIMLYQEDVLNVAKIGAGLSPADADDLRRAIGKKKMDKISEYRDIFVEGAAKTNDISKRVADKIFSDIEYFAGYGFNKAHAICYALISYQTAYLKVHHPIEYMAALMSTVTNKKEKLNLYLGECKSMGINVLSPSVKNSEYHFTVKDPETILFGLSAIEGIGEAQAGHIKEIDPSYTNIWDFMRLANPSALNRKTIGQLIDAGALDDLVRDEDVKLKSLNRRQTVDILNRESAAIGIYLSGHPLDDIWPIISQDISHTCEQANMLSGGPVVMVGMIVDYKELTTKKSGQKMCRLNLEDITGKMSAVVFPNDFYRVSKSIDLESKPICTLHGTIKKESENAEPTIVVRDVIPLDRKLLEGGTPIILDIATPFSESQVAKISDIIDNNRGDNPVYLKIDDDELEITFKFKHSARSDIKPVLEDMVTLTEAQHSM